MLCCACQNSSCGVPGDFFFSEASLVKWLHIFFLPLVENISPLKQRCTVEGAWRAPDKRLQNHLWLSGWDHELGNLFD